MRAYKHPAADALMLECLFYALSDPARLAIVRQLGQIEEASCSELISERPRSSMSHHFRILRESGLIATEIAGTSHRNRLRREVLEQRFPGLLATILSLLEQATDLPAPESNDPPNT